MIVVLEDSGRSLKVWTRKSTRNLDVNIDSPDISINCISAKRVALKMLKPYPARVVPMEMGGKARLLVAVKVHNSTVKALKALSNVERITGRKAAKLLEKPTPRNVLKSLIEAS